MKENEAMDPSTSLKLFFATAIVLVILLAGWYPFKKRQDGKEAHFDLSIGETLSCGVFLGAAMMHMLPESSALFTSQGHPYPWAYLITGLVFLFFLWFEHIGREVYHHDHSKSFAVLAWSMLSIHSLMAGAALGLSHNNSLVIMLFLAIITHKWAESFAIAVELTRSGLSKQKALIFFLSFTLMTPLGMFIGWYSESSMETNSLLDPILIAASAGTFLYLGTLHGLERCVMVERCCNLRDFSYVILGFLLMSSVAAYI